MTKKLLGLVALTFVISAIALLVAAPTEPASAAGGSRAGCSNPGIFTGTDSSGNFQDALEDAIDQADACAGCCDQRIAYEVLETTGERGGFVFLNDIEVKIEASW